MINAKNSKHKIHSYNFLSFLAFIFKKHIESGKEPITSFVPRTFFNYYYTIDG